MLSVPDLHSPFEDPFDVLSSPQLSSLQQPTQSKPVTPPQVVPTIMSILVTVHSFSSEPDDNVQPGEFLKTFRRFTIYTHIKENEQIIKSFGDHLKYTSPADEWFQELDTGTLMWKAVESTFLECFPPIARAKRMETELERELCELRLKDLGKKEKYVGKDVYTHVIFAEKALSLVKQVKISTSSNSIWKVHDELPDIIQQKVKETYSNWPDFCTAIKVVEMVHIRDGVKKYQKEKEEREKTEVAIAGLQPAQQQQRHPPAAPMTPMSSVSHTMQSTTLGSQHGNQPAAHGAPPPMMNNANPFISQSGGQGNLFPCPPLPPVTQAD